MNMKVEHSSSADQLVIPPGVTANPSTTASTSSPKVSLFAKKLGFVIPKNKLSGSLVPIFRDAKKPGSREAVNGKSKEQVQRKTKWGPDLTQETSVRKSRALAYQIRVDQITQQLKSRTLNSDHQDLVEDEASDHKLPNHRINDKNLLELEKRELIGEILKLNPSYKAPHDYKPLLKEAKVPIPIKDYPGYNFIGLFFGSAHDTQKRLEKETGAKIQVYGIKTNTGEKAEINASDGNETINACSEIHVHIAADTYEKVDSAVELIEMLITPISVNSTTAPKTPSSVSMDTINEGSSIQNPPTVSPIGANQEHPSPIGLTQSPLAGQFQPYTSSPWFSVGPATQTLPPPIVNFSAPPPPPPAGNPIQSSFGPRPIPQAGPGPYPGNFPIGPSRPHIPVWQQAPHFSMPQPPLPLGNPPNVIRPMTPPFSQTLFPQGRPPIISQPIVPSPPNFQGPPNFNSRPPPPNLSQNPNLMGGTVNPPIITAPKPLNSRPSDFTFQPHLPPTPNQASSQTVPQPGFQHSHVVQPPPQGMHFRPPVNYAMNHPPNEMHRFGGNPGPNRHPQPFSNSNPNFNIPPMGPRNFGPSPPVPNFGNRPFQQQPGNFSGRPPPNQPFNSNPCFANVRRPISVASGQQQQQQVYDPFSPTAITPQQGSGNPGKPIKSENNDSEYEDLMASVGVK